MSEAGFEESLDYWIGIAEQLTREIAALREAHKQDIMALVTAAGGRLEVTSAMIDDMPNYVLAWERNLERDSMMYATRRRK